MARITKVDYYLNFAADAAMRGTCLRRNYGAVIVKDDAIVSTGYNGAPRGLLNCCDIGECERIKANVPSGQRYELCRSVHAEQNAIIHAGRDKTMNSTMYIAGFDVATGQPVDSIPCDLCKRFILNAGIALLYISCANGDILRIVPAEEWKNM